ncbi:ABC transporter ATP-binding protein [Pedobacter sp.]
MSNISIKAENLSKAYQLGEIGTGTISRDLERWYARIRGKEDPFLRIGETNDRSTKGSSDIVWSLKDINFEIEQGDAVGIIGRNGAGKSTLLKVLSRVTSPTSGRITGKGRIASLLEVGTGFHPELTGRENIYLNGAILGMRKKEITRKFEEIVDFAGVERYIDTPVKRYSSGMYVRLAFAVAAHLESEILIVDEVLAVGDAEFQKKCLGKMGEVSKGEGRTVLFVSHNMAAIRTLCSSTIILQRGEICFNGDVNNGIAYYNSENTQKNSNYIANHHKDTPYFKQASVIITENVNIVLTIANETNTDVVATVLIRNASGDTIVHGTDEVANQKGKGIRNIAFPKNMLSSGDYYITIALGNRYNTLFEKIEDVLFFQHEYDGLIANKGLSWKGILTPDFLKWQ